MIRNFDAQAFRFDNLLENSEVKFIVPNRLGRVLRAIWQQQTKPVSPFSVRMGGGACH